MVLMLADLAKWCVNFVTAGAAIYYFRDAMGNKDMMTIYTLLIAIGGVIGAYAMRAVAKKLSSRSSMILACIGMGACLILVWVFYASSAAVIALMVLANVFYGIAFASAPALYADTVVYATWKTGKDASGWIMGLQNVPLKIGVFLRGTIIAACLTAVGWYDGIVLEGSARQGMTIALGLVPGIFCIVAAVLLIVGFKITKEKVEQWQAEIDKKAA